MRYAVVIEKGARNYSAYVPDLPGCVSVGDTPDEVKAEIREAIAFHLEGLRADGLPIPKPTSACKGRIVEAGGRLEEVSGPTSPSGTSKPVSALTIGPRAAAEGNLVPSGSLASSMRLPRSRKLLLANTQRRPACVNYRVICSYGRSSTCTAMTRTPSRVLRACSGPSVRHRLPQKDLN